MTRKPTVAAQIGAALVTLTHLAGLRSVIAGRCRRAALPEGGTGRPAGAASRKASDRNLRPVLSEVLIQALIKYVRP
jgi:hypothetical protein